MNGDSIGLRQRVIDVIQSGFPLDHDPYGVLAKQLGVTRAQVLEAVASLREDGIIRRIGASISSRHLGYASTLCAIAASGDEAEVDRIAAMVSAHTEVTHNYLRADAFNIWFTIVAPSAAAVARVFDEIRSETGCEVLNLPVTEMYKIRVDFGEAAGGNPVPAIEGVSSFDAGDSFDRALLQAVQGDIGEDVFPFAKLGLDEERALARLAEWKAEGTIRRFGAMVRHMQMGFAFNGMSVWDVAADECARIGRRFASFPFVTHCYGRARCEAWPYNLYAMVHGKTEGELEENLALMRASSGLDCRVLVSLKEYKKTSPVYVNAADMRSRLSVASPFPAAQ